jgi:hypothetical protein
MRGRSPRSSGRSHGENAVEHLPGVTKIENMIRVIQKNRSDAAIEEDIISYLISSPLFKS